MSEEIQIPDKLYFRIGDVAELLNVRPSVLRFWETEFTEIRPVKSKTNQRLYKRQDVETIVSIYQLLYKQKFTIAGAKKKIRELKHEQKSAQADRQIDLTLVNEGLSDAEKERRQEIQEIISEMKDYLKK